jgi:hypothetical protein
MNLGLNEIYKLSVSEIVNLRHCEYQRMTLVTSLDILLKSGYLSLQFNEKIKQLQMIKREYKTVEDRISSRIEELYYAINAIIERK